MLQTSLGQLLWSLQCESRDHPETLKQFYVNLLCDDDNHHRISERVKNNVDSFSADIMHAVFKVLRFNQVANGPWLTQYNWTKTPIHTSTSCWSLYLYHQVNLIETTEVQLVQHYQNMAVGLLLQPSTNDCEVRFNQLLFMTF